MSASGGRWHAMARFMANRLRHLRLLNAGQALLVLVDGGWGSGKSTYLELIGSELRTSTEDGGPWIVVRFSAWRHARTTSPPWWALLYRAYEEVLRQSSLGTRIRLRVAELWWRARHTGLPLVIAIALLGVGGWQLIAQDAQFTGALWALAGISALVFGDGRGFFDNQRLGQSFKHFTGDPYVRIADRFHRLVERTTARPGSHMAVLVDDLDQCDAAYIVEFLQGIQTLFGSTPVTYLVAADAEWLRVAYEAQHETFADAHREPGRTLGDMYLQKVFQFIAPMPRETDELAPVNRDALMSRLGPQVVLEGDTEQELMELAADGQVAVAGRLGERAVAEFTAAELRQEFVLPDATPRAVKRFTDTYLVHRALALVEGRDISRQTLADWTQIEINWPRLANHLKSLGRGALDLTPGWPDRVTWPDELVEVRASDQFEALADRPH